MKFATSFQSHQRNRANWILSLHLISRSVCLPLARSSPRSSKQVLILGYSWRPIESNCSSNFEEIKNDYRNKIFCVPMPWAIMHGHTEDFFKVRDRGKMQRIIDNLLHFLCFLPPPPPTLAPAAYSHGSVAKQWPCNCEAPGSKPCRCAILVHFCGALMNITVIYDLRA